MEYYIYVNNKKFIRPIMVDKGWRFDDKYIVKPDTRMDYTGRRFGDLEVIQRDDIISKSGVIQKRCVCKCLRCGEYVNVSLNNLIQGDVVCCSGCKTNGTINELGNTYGYLTVIDRGPDYIYENGKKEVQWVCRCKCGNITTVRGHALRTGHTRSCGCLAKERNNK